MSRATAAVLTAALGATFAFATSATEALAGRPSDVRVARPLEHDAPHVALRLTASSDATATRTTVVRRSDGIPFRPATSVGMSAERLAAVDRVVLRGIGAGGFPGASVVVGRKGYAVVKRGYGALSWGGAPVDEHTIYDVASLTKVVGTTAAIMVLYDEGKLDLDTPVRAYLPAFTGGAKDRVTVRHLLTHRSGLPAGRELWRSASSPAEARRQVIETPIYCSPGACYEYSDLGADVLGFVAEAVSGQRLDQLLDERVFRPLGMNDTYFRPPAALRARIAPTEVSPPRGYPIRGEVHDENAFALGGVAGHAGLFSTAADLSIYAQMLLNGGEYGGVRVIADSTVRLFTARAAGTRALGWDTCNQKGSCGSLMGEDAFGHTGFTGTSLWVDPERDMFVLLLTNRVHAARALRPAKVIADVRADLADAAELAVADDPNGLRAMPASFRADEASGWNRSATASRGKSRASSSKASRAKSARGSRSAKAKSAKSAKSGKAKSSKSKSAKSSSAKKATAKKATTKKATAKKSTVKKASAKKTPVRKASARSRG
ncbi:MAG: serine hydrolase domain-containing protein [Gemmatirosa sp.]